MVIYYGVVRGGRIDLDTEARLTDGTQVEVRLQPTVEQRTDGQTDFDQQLIAEGLLDRDFAQQLIAEGLLDSPPSVPRQWPAPFEPVEVQGEPISKQIIRERRMSGLPAGTRGMIEAAAPHVGGPVTAEHAFLQQLYAAGLLDAIPDDEQADEPFEPIIVDGEPLSEQIIRERR